ncbi:MAG: hypothetical protein JNK30_19000 [Phenylobacterium sp.]|uniref:hypothetical protein n=1 Tax=Phenylobacterium sp. TaxID=1871053 RepID=UPI001A5C72EC|nr:hypothetical protein [Phenylobacterium sp.]MBL8773481.1 hypothetical protein [Phenylobacterium sp.]
MRALGLAMVVALSAPLAFAQPAPGARQGARVDETAMRLARQVDQAERACLSSTTTTQRTSITGRLQALTDGFLNALGFERKVEAIRGAARTMPAELARIENDAIRTCMTRYLGPAFAATQAAYQAADTTAPYPQPIDLQIRLQRRHSTDPARFSHNVRLLLQPSGRRSPVNVTLAPQDPGGLPYYQYPIAYPDAQAALRGTIVAERKEDAALSSSPPVRTDICLQRPAAYPPQRREYEVLECVEGGQCQRARDSTGWLQVCRPVAEAAPARVWRAAWQPPEGPRQRWVAPSVQSLSTRESEGVGYTIFSLTTDAFRRPDVVAVEVEVTANGVPVEEEGLAPQLRPVANQPDEPFGYSFAVQMLGFTGAYAGCDLVEVGLTAVLADGRREPQRRARMSYVALRDVPTRREALGGDELAWTASYITPAREWRHITEVQSYIYDTRNAAAAERARERAAADKQWLDGAGFTYQGQRIVGVVRPPRTIQPNGSAAFGLAVGLIQPNGQVRFTFSEGETRRMMAHMASLRQTPRARQVIHAEPFLFQARGGARTAPGVCERIG